MVDIKIYTTPTCPWCKKAKEYFKSRRIKYTEFNVVEDEKARKDMIDKSSQMGVPVIDIDGQIIVGFDQAALEKAVPLKKK